MKKYLQHRIRTIFVMLGNDCNLSCRYCLQKPLLKSRQREFATDDVIDFIRDTAENQDNRLGIHFYGGEPLLYWDVICDMIERLKGADLFFSTITNGTLLNEEKAHWLNDHDFNVAVSYDGAETKKTRIVDVMEIPEARKAMLMLNRLSFSTILSKYCYPKQVIDDMIPFMEEYHALHEDAHASINYDIVFDTGIANKDTLGADPERLNAEMKVLCDELKKKIKGEEHNPYYAHMALEYWQSLTESVRNRDTFEMPIAYCGNGYSVLNMDVKGNFYRCHNTSEKVGTIYDSYMALLRSTLLHDTTRELMKECKCVECPVVAVCGGGCQLVNREARLREGGFCDLRRAAFQPYVNLLMELGAEAARLGV